MIEAHLIDSWTRSPDRETPEFGVAMIVAGVAGMSVRRPADLLHADRRAVFFALVTAGFIAAYTLVDGHGSRRSGNPHGYAVLLFVIIKLVPRIGHPAWAVAIGLLCAGVAGNLTDRLFRPPGVLRGHVIDFLELPYWPVFNVADMCITAAAILIIFLSIVKGIAISGERHGRTGRRGAGDDGRRRPVFRRGRGIRLG